MTPALHWTLNNSPYDKELMLREITETLETLQRSYHSQPSLPASVTRRFQMIPTISRGFSREGDPVYHYQVGTLDIQTRAVQGGVDYSVRRRHRASGEHNTWTFQTDPDHRLRPEQPWGLDARCSGNGTYGFYQTKGSVTSDGELRTTLRNGLEVPLGSLVEGEPPYTQFSLMAGADLSALSNLAVVEDLERLKPHCSIRRFDTWTCRLTDQPMALTGYILAGEGQEPVYLWTDSLGTVIFAGNIFTTYVLKCVHDRPVEARPIQLPASGVRTRPIQTSSSRPNILFINTDQQHVHAISAQGNPHLRTPAIDSLFANGLSFERSYCADPVCGPARSSWITSRYTSESSGIGNAGKVHRDLPDLPTCLREGGYRAYHSGKHHCLRDVGMIFDLLYDGLKQIGASGGEYYDAPSCRAVIDFLDTDPGDTPWYIQLGIVNPHDFCECLHFHENNSVPNITPDDAIAPDELPPVPENIVVQFRETVLQESVHRSGSQSPINPGIADAKAKWSDDHWRWLAWNYYRYVERADQDVAAVLHALRASPFAESTIVIFSSDHGEAHGHHRNTQKFSLYEESIRVPFVVAEFGDRFGIPKGQRDHEHFVSGVDLMPTILDLAGIAPPASLQGRSLKPFLQSRTPEHWPDYVYVENNYYGRCIIQGRYKLITEYLPNPDDAEQRIPPRASTHALGRVNLFDLEADPLETREIGEEHPEIVSRLIARLQEREATLETRPVHPRISGMIEKMSASMATPGR